jgi:hypothetical protein
MDDTKDGVVRSFNDHGGGIKYLENKEKNSK